MLLFFFFNVLVFWPWSMWDLTSPIRERTCTPALEGAVLIADSEGSSATVHFKVLAQEGSMELWLWSGQWGKRQLPGIRCMCQARTPLIYWLLPSHWINHYLNWWEELDSLVLYPKLLTPSFTHIIFLIKLTTILHCFYPLPFLPILNLDLVLEAGKMKILQLAYCSNLLTSHCGYCVIHRFREPP